MLFAAAAQEVPDRQGRVSIPSVLREYASLGKDVMVIGAMDRIEIWDPASWRTYSEEQEQKFSEISDEVFPGSSPGTAAPSTTRTQQPDSQDEVSGPLPGHLGHLPRFQRTTSQRWERAGTWSGESGTVAHRQQGSKP